MRGTEPSRERTGEKLRDKETEREMERARESKESPTARVDMKTEKGSNVKKEMEKEGLMDLKTSSKREETAALRCAAGCGSGATAVAKRGSLVLIPAPRPLPTAGWNSWEEAQTLGEGLF